MSPRGGAGSHASQMDADGRQRAMLDPLCVRGAGSDILRYDDRIECDACHP
jgi:hypothetical protein